MSSESLSTEHAEWFRWSAELDPALYVFARYRIVTAQPVDVVTLAMAREQSACTTSLPIGDLELRAHTARVVSIDDLGPSNVRALPRYRLTTSVYADVATANEATAFEVVIAYPTANLKPTASCLLNHCYGEIARLGFLDAAKLIELKLPETFEAAFPGPHFGAEGFRKRLGVYGRPFFCRSTRPAVGLDTNQLLQVIEPVLRGGFDAIKDDELSEDLVPSTINERYQRVAALRDRLVAETGERKLLFANLIAEDQFEVIAECARRHGFDGVLVAPGLNGFGAIRRASELGFIVLAHNAGVDGMVRPLHVGISEAVWTQLCRLSGADLIMMPGEFGGGTEPRAANAAEAAVLAECCGPMRGVPAAVPVLAGGKRPERLPLYRGIIGSDDYFLIIATAVDDHPEGIEVGARAFRLAC
ncbi:MAG: hypothetical protein IPK97_12945 [Ahniella sp.]|nr:hypothetical protein [Ahniella sp.]